MKRRKKGRPFKARAYGQRQSDGPPVIEVEPEEFAAACVRVLNDDALARTLGAQAAATVRTRFGWDRVAAEFAALCEQACKVKIAERAAAPCEAERLEAAG